MLYWRDTWLRWFLVPVRHKHVRSIRIITGPAPWDWEHRFEVVQDWAIIWARKGASKRLMVSGDPLIHIVEVPAGYRLDFKRRPGKEQWDVINIRERDNSVWVRYDSNGIVVNRNPERGDRIEPFSMEFTVEEDVSSS